MPYPNYPPCYKIVRQLGGVHRTCLVVELSTESRLDNAAMAIIEDKITMMLQKDSRINRVDVVGEGRFSIQLLQALRLGGYSPEQLPNPDSSEPE